MSGISITKSVKFEKQNSPTLKSINSMTQQSTCISNTASLAASSANATPTLASVALATVQAQSLSNQAQPVITRSIKPTSLNFSNSYNNTSTTSTDDNFTCDRLNYDDSARLNRQFSLMTSSTPKKKSSFKKQSSLKTIGRSMASGGVGSSSIDGSEEKVTVL